MAELVTPDCTCGQGNVWGYPNGSGHSQGCPYRFAMMPKPTTNKEAIRQMSLATDCAAESRSRGPWHRFLIWAWRVTS